MPAQYGKRTSRKGERGVEQGPRVADPTGQSAPASTAGGETALEDEQVDA